MFAWEEKMNGDLIMTDNVLKKKDGIGGPVQAQGLPCWREVVHPHPDVAQGRYNNAGFAADIAQVVQGKGAYEYQDPVEFFARTYITEGMAGLLEQVLRRMSGRGGEPIIQITAAFGGGKTHNMLALYHMVQGRASVDKLPNLKPVLEKAGIVSLPKANVVVLVGTALDPTKAKRSPNLPSVAINTLWGDMAAHLVGATGDVKLYDYVKEADKRGVSPGSEALKGLFDACSPCLVLMDEMVSYGKKIYGVQGLPAGTFDNFISFIQEVTEAAKASQHSLVVTAIPESDIEIGGEAGKTTLKAIKHILGRVETIWKPAMANESLEIVRRRLFLDCKDAEARDRVCKEFSKMYHDNQEEFPLESQEVEYLKRMISCYPIHPEVFDRLYEDWVTLDHFQRTRGVLRLMAAVVHELWIEEDTGLLIMPGSIPMCVPAVCNELTHHLSEGWNALVGREIDGISSIPVQKELTNQRYYRRMACRRVSRTIMLGSAPSYQKQRIRGIEVSRIHLGIIQPGEKIPVFNDALNTLTDSLNYLHTDLTGGRFWYDARPTLRKTVEDRLSQFAELEADFEIEMRLRSLRKEAPFSSVHICPSSSLDVPDIQGVRLVILRPTDTYEVVNLDNPAMSAAKEILNYRGNAPRIYRNMVAFMAPARDLIMTLRQTVRRFLAWKSVKENREDLNLDVVQSREVDNNLTRFNKMVDEQIKEAYCWLLVPYIDTASDLKTIVWDKTRISGRNETIIGRAANMMRRNEEIITRWAPVLLKMELDNVLWATADHIEINKLWEYICTYCYLPRLANESVLIDTILSGIASSKYFAYARGFDGTQYLDLKFNQDVETIDRSAYLVKIPVARKQLDRQANRQAEGIEAQGHNTEIMGAQPTGTIELSQNKRFYMRASLDTTYIDRDMQRLIKEVVVHLTSVEGTDVEVHLEVKAQALDGFSRQIARTVSENCRTLHIKDFGFID